jgi:hypothetical protein
VYIKIPKKKLDIGCLDTGVYIKSIMISLQEGTRKTCGQGEDYGPYFATNITRQQSTLRDVPNI